MRNHSARVIALGGMLAALAVVIMCMGGFLVIATYTCPALCMMLLQVVQRLCGRRIAWAWYGAVALLGLMLGPDKEAALVFVFLGYYPLLKPLFDRSKLRWLLKLLFFNAVTLVLYWLMMNIFGMDQITAEFRELGIVMTVVTLLLGNITFLLLDRLLERKFRFRKGGG